MKHLIILFALMASSTTLASLNSGIVLNGKVLNPDGTKFVDPGAYFQVQIIGQSNLIDGVGPGVESCVLYSEIQPPGLIQPEGNFSLVIGEGSSPQFGTGITDMSKIFINPPVDTTNQAGAFKIPAVSCQSASGSRLFVPDRYQSDRLLNVTIVKSDGQRIEVGNMKIKSIPFAHQAREIGGYGVNQIAKVGVANSKNFKIFSDSHFNFLVDLFDSNTNTINAQNSEIINVNTNSTNPNSAANVSFVTSHTVSDNQLPNVGTPGPYGSTSNALVITTDAKGRVTTVTSNPISITVSQLQTTTGDNGLILMSNGTTWSAQPLTASNITGVVKSVVGTAGNLTVNATDPENPIINLASSGVSAGTYTKLTVDAFGRVTSGTGLVAADIPNLDWTKITSGLPTTLGGYGITNAVRNGGGTSAITSGLDGVWPTTPAPANGDLFVATDTRRIYRYDLLTTNWDVIASTGISGLTVDSGRLLGRFSAGNGPAEQITLGPSLSLSALGELTATVSANGPTNAVQYKNSGGNFEGSANFTFDAASNNLAVAGSIRVGNDAACSAAGKIRYSGTSLDYCNGTSWVTLGVAGSGVQSVAATGGSPIVIAGTATAPTVGINQASTTTDGYLSSANFNTFNDKIGAVTGSNGITAVTTGTSVAITMAACANGEVRKYNTALLPTPGWECSASVGAETDPVYSAFASASRTQNQVFAGPLSGSGVAAFRNLQIPDIRSNVTGAWFQASGSCPEGQMLTYLSGSDNVTCQNFSVKAANDLGACNAGRLGVVRMNGANLEFCNGTGWTGLAASGSGISSLGVGGSPQTGNSQTLAIGTTGTAPSWNSASDTHTLNIPMASTSGVTAGLLSNGDHVAFTAKLSNTLANNNIFVGAAGVATGVPMSGDASIASSGSVTVTGIHGRGITNTAAPTNGQVLQYSSGNWGYATLSGSAVGGFANNSFITSNSTGNLAATTLAANRVVSTDASGLPAALSAGTAGQVLTSNGAAAPTWQAPAVNGITTLTGDVTATGTGSVAATVARIRGVNVAATAPGISQVLRFDGTNWAPATLVPADISGVGDITEVAVAVGGGLSGGGTTGAVTVGLAQIPANSFLANTTAGSAVPTNAGLNTQFQFSGGNLTLTENQSNSAFINGGNNFGGTTASTIGNNNAGDLNIETGGTTRMNISGSSGNVGVGQTANANLKMQVNGAGGSVVNVIPSGANVNMSLGNIHVLEAPGGSTINLSNIVSGATYTLIVSDTANSRTYTFSGACTNTYFSPANGPTSFQSTYTILAVQVGAAMNCYVAWITDFQP